jgi:hypothetical protein
MPSGAVHALGDRNAQVLVKADQPVILNRLQEQGALNRHGFNRQQSRYSIVAHQTPCKLTTPTKLDQAPRADSIMNEFINKSDDRP